MVEKNKPMLLGFSKPEVIEIAVDFDLWAIPSSCIEPIGH
jgi:hypothetical protein